MKRVLLCSFAFILFGCMQEEQPAIRSQEGREINTVDTILSYHSPYNFMSSGYLENQEITYSFINHTDLDFNVFPYFGFAYNSVYNNPSIYDPSEYPNLHVNGEVFGNYLEGSEIKVAPHSTYTVYSEVYAVPVPEVLNLGEDRFLFPLSYPELPEVAKRGKLYYIGVSVDQQSELAKVKLPAPKGAVHHDGTTEYPWELLSEKDMFTFDKMIYNAETLEVCSPITNTYYEEVVFSFSNRYFFAKVYMSTSSIEVVLKEII